MMRLYFPDDLTGNLLVLGGISTEDLSIFNPDALTSAPLLLYKYVLSHAYRAYYVFQHGEILNLSNLINKIMMHQ